MEEVRSTGDASPLYYEGNRKYRPWNFARDQ